MIEISDLRINNLVQYNGHILRVASINRMEARAWGGAYDVSNKEFYEIELGKKILEWIGFTFNEMEDKEDFIENGWGDLSYWDLSLPHADRSMQIFLDYSCNFYFREDQELKYLHRLQNLYYDLVGTELPTDKIFEKVL